MSGPDTLTDQEEREVVALAEYLYRQDSKQAAVSMAEQVGIPPEYVRRAVAVVLGNRKPRRVATPQLRERTAANRRVSMRILASCIVGVIAVAYGFDLLFNPPVTSPTVHVQQAPKPPIPKSTLVSMLPVRTKAPMMLLGMDPTRVVGLSTEITFSNETGEAVNLFWIGAAGHWHFYQTLTAGGELDVSSTPFGYPWFATTLAKKPIGMFFPAGIPSRAVIATEPVSPNTSMDGYLSSEPVSDMTPVQPELSDASAGVMEVANLSNQTLELYRSAKDGSPTWITPLPPGANYISSAFSPHRWIVTDQSRKIVRIFDPSPVSEAAVILSPSRSVN
jgi:hypothetical protein